jgi:tetratricopeptide (TPR) repeat protein
MFHIRRKLGITQKQLATPEFSISYISAIERGRIRPSLKALDILARRLGVTSAELLAEPLEDGVDGRQSSEEDGLVTLRAQLNQRPAPSLAGITLCWASIYITQRLYPLARELLEALPPNSMSAEQRLLRLYFLSHITLAEGRPADSQVMLERALQQAEFSGHTEMLIRCRFLLACTYEAQEQFLLADATFKDCIQAIEKGIADEPFFVIQVYSALADHHRRLERYETALTWYQRALELLDFILNPLAMADTSAQLSRHHLANVHSTLADWYAARSRVLYEFAGMRNLFTQIASNLALTYKELGDTEAAERQLQQTIAFSAQLGTHRQGILTRIALADLLLERQETEEAERLALEAQKLCRPGEEVEAIYEALYGRVLITLGDINKALHRLDEAERCFQEAIELLKKYNASDHLSQAYFRYSDLLHQKGQDAESYEMVRQAFLLTQRNPPAGG